MAAEFFHKYRKLFYEDEDEPVSLEHFLASRSKNKPTFAPHTNLTSLAQKHEIFPKDYIPEPVSVHPKLPFNESTPETIKTKFKQSPKPSYSPFRQESPALRSFKEESPDVSFEKKPPSRQKLPPIKHQVETKEHIFPQKLPETKSAPPLQSAKQRRKEASNKIEYRRERLRDLLSQDKVTLQHYNR